MIQCDVETVRSVCNHFASPEASLGGDDEDEDAVDKICSNIFVLPIRRQAMLILPNDGQPWLAIGYAPHVQQGDIICGILSFNIPLVVKRQ
jgi:hypothetical protein